MALADCHIQLAAHGSVGPVDSDGAPALSYLKLAAVEIAWYLTGGHCPQADSDGLRVGTGRTERCLRACGHRYAVDNHDIVMTMKPNVPSWLALHVRS